MSKFRLGGGLSLRPGDITVIEDELEENNWRDRAAELVKRREKALRKKGVEELF